MEKIEREMLVKAEVAGGCAKGNNAAVAQASENGKATAEININQPAK